MLSLTGIKDFIINNQKSKLFNKEIHFDYFHKQLHRLK